MELFEIIKQTIFLIILLGFGVFSLSYSISKIRSGSKPEILPSVPRKSNPTKFQKIEIPKSILRADQTDIRRKTSERFTVVNDLTSEKKSSCQARKNNDRNYTLHAISNTEMYTLKFR